MKRHSRQGAALCALGIAAALFTAGARADVVERPFTATLKFTESVQLTFVPPCFGTGVLNGSGNSSHLGVFNLESRDCINPLAFGPTGPTSYQFVSTAAPGVVFTAANGDRLFACYAGTLRPQPVGPHILSGYFVITGGTGHFVNATGGGTLLGTEDISRVVVAEGQVTLSGSISY